MFAGIGGLRLGFEMACKASGYQTSCVLTSEIKPFAIKVLQQNFEQQNLVGDITHSAAKASLISMFYQPVSLASHSAQVVCAKVLPVPGVLYFVEIERILAEKKPQGFILENIEGPSKTQFSK